MLLLVSFLLFIIPLVIVVMATNYYKNEPNDYLHFHWNEREEITEAREKYRKHIFYQIVQNDNEYWFIGASILFGIILFIMLICLIGNRINPTAQGRSYQEKQKALEYKISTDYAQDEFGLRNKELVDEIQEWNESVVKWEENEHNIWIGVFYPKLIDEYNLHTIELK